MGDARRGRQQRDMNLGGVGAVVSCLLVLFVGACCGGVNKADCEAAKVEAYQAWSAYHNQLAAGGDAGQAASAATVRDTYLAEEYSAIAEAALLTAVDAFLPAPDTATDAHTMLLASAKVAVADKGLNEALLSAEQVLDVCRSEGEPWPLGERLQVIAQKQSSIQGQQDALVVAAQMDSVSTLLALAEDQATGSQACTQIMTPEGPVDTEAWLDKIDHRSDRMEREHRTCSRKLVGASLVETAYAPSIAPSLCEAEALNDIRAVFERGDRRFEALFKQVHSFGESTSAGSLTCREIPLDSERARHVVNRFDLALGTDAASALQHVHCCDLRQNGEGEACRPELLEGWQPQLRSNRNPDSTSGQSWGWGGPTKLDELELQPKSPAAHVAYLGWDGYMPGRTGMDEDEIVKRSVALVRSGDDWKILGVVGLVDNRSYRVFGKQIPREQDNITFLVDLHSRSTQREIRRAISGRCFVDDEQARLEKLRRVELERVESLRAAMRAFERSNGYFASCNSTPSGFPDVEPRPWEGEDTDCFTKLGWSPGEESVCSYATNTYRGTDFWAEATCDLDGDGTTMKIMAMKNRSASISTDDDVY